MDDLTLLGPLAPLAGTWEGTGGLDVSYHHDVDAVANTEFLERMTLSPFGPVDNGDQCLYGLDYRTAAWRDGEEDPFHTEVGYWLWDAAAGLVMRCFLVPRSTMVLAGGEATPDSRTFTMSADLGSTELGILQNPYLSKRASTVRYEVTITVHDDGSFTYEEDTVLKMPEVDDLLHHTDRNTLRRVGA